MTALKDLSDAELGSIVRQSPLWDILLEQEEKEEETGAMDRAPAAEVHSNVGLPR